MLAILALLASPLREPGRSFESYLQEERAKPSLFEDKKPKRNTVTRNAIAYQKAQWERLTEFNGTKAEFLELFRFIRDERFFTDPKSPSFKRRIPWLFPDDGCPLRAEWIARKAYLKNSREVFQKVFLFGDLDLATPYHPNGNILWWFHVAPGIKFQGVPYVFDPSVRSDHPLTVTEWASLLSSPHRTRIAICNVGALDPYSLCDAPQFAMSSLVALKTLFPLLHKERARISELGLNASEVLGDHPPWLTH